MAATEFIRVNARLRPSDAKPAFVVNSDRTVIRSTTAEKHYLFDRIFGPDSTQEAIFQEVGKRVIDGAVEGINGTIFAYGQTGSGKTHTMLGPPQDYNSFCNSDEKGLIPRCVEYLFARLDEMKTQKGSVFSYILVCSFIELYNEALCDLLTTNCPPVSIRTEDNKIILQGASCEAVTSYVDAIKLIQIGWSNRTVGQTNMNKESSRSHAVLTLDLTLMENYDGIINSREARINLVDLAGSERQRDTHSTGVRLKEAAKINQSLTTLGRVIRELSSKKSHVPYRDSKLTLMIRDSLGGNSRTAVIVCAHPGEEYMNESLSTLQFAERCRLVKNEVHFNREVSGESITALRLRVKQLQDELESTKKEYEEQMQQIEKERDYYMEKAENNHTDCKLTTPSYDSPFPLIKTPAAKKNRRRTRFTLSSQSTVRECTQRFSQPIIWGDEINSADDKENIEMNNPPLPAGHLEAFKNLIRENQDELTILQNQKVEVETKLEDAESHNNRLQEANRLLREELLEKLKKTESYENKVDELHISLKVLSGEKEQFKNILHEKDEELFSLRKQKAEMEAKLKEVQSAYSQIESLQKQKDISNKKQEYEKKFEELQKVALSKIAESNKLNYQYTQKQQECSELKQKIEENDYLIKILQEQVSQLTNVANEQRSLRKQLDIEKSAKLALDAELFDSIEARCAAETKLALVEATLADKEQEISSLTQDREALQSELSDIVGHKNNQQRIKMMDKYRTENATLKDEIVKLKAKNEKYEKMLHNK